MRVFSVLIILSLALPLEAAKKPKWTKINKAALGHLVSLIKINTENTAANEAEAAVYIEKVFKANGIEAEIFTSTKGRSGVIARLKAKADPDAQEAAGKPLLLMSHLDTASPKSKNWKIDPWGAEQKKGFIYGLGAMDSKALLAANMAVFLAIKSIDPDLSRDVVFLALPDGMGGGNFGIKWLIANRKDALDAEFALLPGGFSAVDNGEVSEVVVQCAEKLTFVTRIKAIGKSVFTHPPHPENPIVILAKAISRLNAHVYSTSLNSITSKYFSLLGKNYPGYQFGTLEYSMVRNIVVPTQINGGARDAADSAWVLLNINALPQTNENDLLEELKRVISDPRVSFDESMFALTPKTGMSSVKSVFYKAIEASAQDVYPEAKTAPFMSPWTTNAAHLRKVGVRAYGIGMPRERSEPYVADGNRAEKVSKAMFEKTIRFVYGVIKNSAIK
ncbi:M20/M25/M40 family metallo-hydrolase [Elusimicrobiota bacterium]